MYPWLEANISAVLRNYLHLNEEGQVELILVVAACVLDRSARLRSAHRCPVA